MLRNLRKEKKKTSNFIVFLFTFYMCSILVFSSNSELNVYSKLLFLVTFGCIAVTLIFRIIPLKFDIYVLTFFLFMFFCRVSTVWAIDANLAKYQCSTLFQIFVMSVVFLSYVVYGSNTEPYIKSLLISGVIGCIYVIGFYGFDGYMKMLMDGERVGTEINNVNAIGMYMTCSVIIGFFYGYVRKKKLGYLAMILPLILAFGSASRKALVGMTIGILLIIILEFWKKTDFKSFLKLTLAITLAILLIWWFSTLPVFSTMFERFEDMLGIGSQGKTDSSTLLRNKLREAGWNYFTANPFSGCGIGNSRYISGEMLGRFTYLHNNFIELLASVGIIGFSIYYFMYAYILLNLYRVYRKIHSRNAMILFVILAVNLLMDYGMVSYYSKTTYIYLTLGAAEIIIKNNNLKEIYNNGIKKRAKKFKKNKKRFKKST